VNARAIAAVAAVVVVADRLTKLWIMSSLQPGAEIPVIPGFFSIVYLRNPGAAFGMFANLASPARELLLIAVAVVAVAVLVQLVRATEPDQRIQRFAAASVIGGAIGNLWDRMAYGEVIDFLYFYWRDYYWPAFNVADSSISVGAVLLVLSTFVASERSASR
jgi:signal peptidase II